MKTIIWTDQHCGVRKASFDQLKKMMPDLAVIQDSFPEDVNDFTWDVKVHMLMPKQFPCIPNWHYDNIPRIGKVQDFDSVQLDKPMYLWLSNEPLTKFRNDNGEFTVEPRTWIRFTQADEHKGTVSEKFQWRGFIRATHKDIVPHNEPDKNVLRRHSQVYLDSNNFNW